MIKPEIYLVRRGMTDPVFVFVIVIPFVCAFNYNSLHPIFFSWEAVGYATVTDVCRSGIGRGRINANSALTQCPLGAILIV